MSQRAAFHSLHEPSLPKGALNAITMTVSMDPPISQFGQTNHVFR